MRIFAGGREVEVPTDTNGQVQAVDVRRAMDIPDDRVLIQQRQDGGNLIVPKRGNVNINPQDRFMDAPRSERG